MSKRSNRLLITGLSLLGLQACSPITGLYLLQSSGSQPRPETEETVKQKTGSLAPSPGSAGKPSPSPSVKPDGAD